MSQRYRAARLALQGLCCLDVQGERVAGLVDEFIRQSREGEQIIEAARQILAEASARLAHCDRLLAGHIRDWDLRRLAMVDRNILRLTVAQLLDGASYKVTANIALRLAREFSTAESPRFINGVLDAIAKQVNATQEGES